MLPLQQAYETKEAILEYLKATFSFKDKDVSKAFYDFIENEECGISHEPYISLKTPFTSADNDGSDLMDIVPGYTLYKHQYLSFERLTSKNGNMPKPTLLTTGTGSGKTECFLFPLLDYCYQWRNTHENKEGIKAIILYPMNALASDQAKRLAEAIYKDERLRGKVTAGLFIGEGHHREKTYPKTMGEHNIIEDRDQILQTPPDIILTNFKMLDYALMKHNYACLWSHNFQDASMLKFLVLDELHTYDGAQGTDVANLIRRLKLKLAISPKSLCPVGTSATIGSGPDSKKLLCNYASDVFGEEFDETSVIVEDRVELKDVASAEVVDFVPELGELTAAKFTLDDNYEKYIDKQKHLWHLEKENLAEGLAKLRIVRDITDITYDNYVRVAELIEKLADVNIQYRAIQEEQYKNIEEPRKAVLYSLFALIAEAKKGIKPKFPFLYLQVQLWLRELSGFLRVMSKDVQFTWRKDVNKSAKEQLALPAYFCRECGDSGWIAYKTNNSPCLSDDPVKTASSFINNNEHCYLLNLYNDEHKPIEEYSGEIYDWWIDPSDLHVYNVEGDPEEGRIHVYAMRKTEAGKNGHNPKFVQHCPSCCSENSLTIIGTKVATLASVAISQVMSSDMDSEEESGRKILAFTNSVQDAAHQAGFFEARNYRFSLRNAIQNCVRYLEEQKRLPMSLEHFQQEFIKYWKEKLDFEHNQKTYVYRFFPPDKLGEIDLNAEYRIPDKQFKEGFIEQLDLRLGWEITSEFGFNARIGRTLEKSGASATYFEEDKLLEVYELMRGWLQEKNLGKITRQHFVQFLNGVLHRMRMRGAVDHPFLRCFRENKSTTFFLNNKAGSTYYLHRYFGARARYPKLVSTSRLESESILDSTYVSARNTNWYKLYFLKCFTRDLSYGDIPMSEIPPQLYNDFFKELFTVLCKVGVCNQSERESERNYCIAPSALNISHKVKHIGCYKCTSLMCVAEEDEVSENTMCLEYKCMGQYNDIRLDNIRNYYYNVYNRTLSPRIFSHEHTGILNRQKRESIEYQFKSNEGKNSVNTLVATSTLEMGIDIGDLNVALNTSIPPMPSNFIQRVGRAGRKSGAALIVDFARNEYHDLFYYAEPKEMMQGKINTPGCYLSAVDILRRHFFAFCLDTWTGLDNQNNKIPNKVILLPLQTFKTDANSFYNRIISFIEGNGSQLLDKFRTQYTYGQKEALESLVQMLCSGEFINRVRKEFDKIYTKYMGLSNRIRDTREIIYNSGLGESDEERHNLEIQLKVLLKTRRGLMNQQVLEFMTNAGLLPNYAFPESGVNLAATIIHRPKEGEKYTIEELEIQRSASSALRELAPGNHFYAQKYRMNISGLSTLNWYSGDKEALVQKRFCSACDYIEDVRGGSPSQCPICGDQNFGTPANVHTFVRMDDVRSSDKKEKAVMDDKSDERDSNFYITSKHFKFDGGINASGLRTIPFGIEYCKSVDVTDINLGDAEQRDARSLNINEHEDIPVKGFVTCKYCGKSTSRSQDLNVQSSEELHYPFCKHKDKMYNDKADDVFEEVFLYHTFHTEAIKVLLPVQDIDTEATTNMFAAGLELGLRDYFEGNPDHIRIEKYKAYNDDTQKFDRYLILYDTIPGGTGYLAQISRPSEFERILQNAWDRIHNCDCQNHGKDGCYHCIFTYANQRIQDKLSRKKADELFRKILDCCYDEKTHESNWETVKNLGNLSNDGGLEESELEKSFIYALERFAHNDSQQGGTHHWAFKRDTSAFREQYTLTFDDGLHKIIYNIIPQYVLDSSKGVAYHTEPDFLIQPVGMSENRGHGWVEVNFYHLKSIAIYMDGYRYHASGKHNVFAKDFQKRQSIDASTRYTSFTLTWKDMDIFAAEDHRDDTIIDRHNNKILQQLGPNAWITKRNSMERLLHYLGNLWQDKKLKDSLTIYIIGLQANLAPPYTLFKAAPWASIDIKVDMQKRQLVSDLKVDDDYHPEDGLPMDMWQDFWRAYNLTSLYRGLDVVQQTPTQTNEWEKIAGKFDDDLHDIVLQLLEQGIAFNHDAGVAIKNSQGQKVCEGELVSEELHFVFFPDDEDAAEEAGYQIFEPETFNINDIQRA